MELRERKSADDVETLKDKLKMKWHERDFTPKKEDSDKFTMRFFFAMFISLLLECGFYIIPHLENCWVHAVVVLVLFFQVMINWHRSYFDTANYVTAEMKTKLFPDSTETPPGWKSCIKCQVDVPPRAFHCSFCGKCMLKRVHHCFLTGSCIGYFNQKYFVIFCLWSTIGSAYCMFLQMTFLNIDLPLNSTNFITYIPPVTLHQLIIGNISIGQAFIVAHFFVCAPVFLVSLFFFFWNILFVVEGVTKYEAYHNQFFYKRSLLENINTVFGSVLYIPVLIIFPFRLPQSGDGIQWKLRAKGN